MDYGFERDCPVLFVLYLGWEKMPNGTPRAPDGLTSGLIE